MYLHYVHLLTRGTYKLLWYGETIKELYTAKVITSSQSCTRVIQMSCVDVSLVSILGPNADHLLTKYTVTVCHGVCMD